MKDQYVFKNGSPLLDLWPLPVCCVFSNVAIGYRWISDTKFQKFLDKNWIWMCKNFFGYGSGVKKFISAHLCYLSMLVFCHVSVRFLVRNPGCTILHLFHETLQWKINRFIGSFFSLQINARAVIRSCYKYVIECKHYCCLTAPHARVCLVCFEMHGRFKIFFTKFYSNLNSCKYEFEAVWFIWFVKQLWKSVK